MERVSFVIKGTDYRGSSIDTLNEKTILTGSSDVY